MTRRSWISAKPRPPKSAPPRGRPRPLARTAPPTARTCAGPTAPSGSPPWSIDRRRPLYPGRRRAPHASARGRHTAGSARRSRSARRRGSPSSRSRRCPSSCRVGSRPLLAVLAYVPCGQPRRAGLVALSLHGDDSCVWFRDCCGGRGLCPVLPSVLRPASSIPSRIAAALVISGASW